MGDAEKMEAAALLRTIEAKARAEGAAAERAEILAYMHSFRETLDSRGRPQVGPDPIREELWLRLRPLLAEIEGGAHIGAGQNRRRHDKGRAGPGGNRRTEAGE